MYQEITVNLLGVKSALWLSKKISLFMAYILKYEAVKCCDIWDFVKRFQQRKQKKNVTKS